jgi:hypothetical protein
VDAQPIMTFHRSCLSMHQQLPKLMVIPPLLHRQPGGMYGMPILCGAEALQLCRDRFRSVVIPEHHRRPACRVERLIEFGDEADRMPTVRTDWCIWRPGAGRSLIPVAVRLGANRRASAFRSSVQSQRTCPFSCTMAWCIEISIRTETNVEDYQ